CRVASAGSTQRRTRSSMSFRLVPVGTSTLRGTTASSGRRPPAKTWCIGSIRTPDKGRPSPPVRPAERGVFGSSCRWFWLPFERKHEEIEMHGKRNLSSAIALVVATLLLTTTAVQAVYPGKDGRLAFGAR